MKGFAAGWRYFWSAIELDATGAWGFVTALLVFTTICDVLLAHVKWMVQP